MSCMLSLPVKIITLCDIIFQLDTFSEHEQSKTVTKDLSKLKLVTANSLFISHHRKRLNAIYLGRRLAIADE